MVIIYLIFLAFFSRELEQSLKMAQMGGHEHRGGASI